jgi:hypothetical protein
MRVILAGQATTILAADFFRVDTVFPRCLCVLFFIEYGTRGVLAHQRGAEPGPGAAAHPDPSADQVVDRRRVDGSAGEAVQVLAADASAVGGLQGQVLQLPAVHSDRLVPIRARICNSHAGTGEYPGQGGDVRLSERL